MNAVHRSIQPDAIGGMLAAIGSAFVGVGAVQTAGSHQNVWFNPWFDGGCAVLTTGFLIAISVIIPWWRSRRSQTRGPEIAIQERQADDQDSPLHLLLQPGVWRLFAGTLWSFGIPVRVTNITEEPITLAHYRLLNGPGATQRPQLTQGIQGAVNAWVATLSAEHNSELFAGEIVVPPGASITRWFIGSAYAPLPDGGRPALTLQFEDVSNDTYERDIPARPPRTYRSS
jgi:hypothetical protein